LVPVARGGIIPSVALVHIITESADMDELRKSLSDFWSRPGCKALLTIRRDSVLLQTFYLAPEIIRRCWPRETKPVMSAVSGVPHVQCAAN
jgi:hypothetical protein